VKFGISFLNLHPRGFADLTRDVSDGRAEVGIGAGFEFRAADVDFASRGRRVDECIEICKRLWTEPQIAHTGEFSQFDAVGFEPKPSVSIRVHVGGESRAALRRAARHGAGWISMENTVDTMRDMLDEALGAVCRDRRAFAPKIGLGAS
jgi:alkanesulfonate monooxygenase SsuD/methylene tetrahydromethanopterin reductase-like flavin-dependent oxidoreductase (luciferase family)